MRKLALFSALAVFSVALGCAAPSEEHGDVDANESALSGPWQKLLTCDDGAAVLDVFGTNHQLLQVVVRDPAVLRYLNDVGAIRSRFGATEEVVQGTADHVDWTHGFGPRLPRYASQHDPGADGPADFREMLRLPNGGFPGTEIFGSFVRVAREGGGMKLQFGRMEDRGCANGPSYSDEAGEHFQCFEHFTAYIETANWYFEQCQ